MSPLPSAPLAIATATLLAAAAVGEAAAAPPIYVAAEQALRKRQAMPRSAEIRGSTCAARVRVSVDGNGLITRYTLVNRCPDAILDRATEDLLFKVGQLPPPPGRRAGNFELSVRWPPRD